MLRLILITLFSLSFPFFGMADVVIPPSISGTWLSSNNEMRCGFYNDIVIYNGDFFNYKKITEDKGTINIRLSKDQHIINLQVLLKPEGVIEIVNNNHNSGLLSRTRNLKPDFKPYNTATFDTALKPGIFHLSGFVRDHEKSGYKYLRLIYNSLVNINQQKDILIKINADGCFTTDVVINHPIEMLLQCGDTMTQIYGVPNSDLAVSIQAGSFTQGKISETQYRNILNEHVFFSGKSGLLNTEINTYLPRLSSILSNDDNEALIAGLNKENYKNSRLLKKDEELRDLDKYSAEYHSSTKFVQYMKNYIIYSCGDDLTRYLWLKNNKKRIIPDTAYLTFLKEIPLNNKQALVTDKYNLFLRDWLLIDFGLNNSKFSNTPQITNIIFAAKQAGYSFDTDDEQLIIKFYTLKEEGSETSKSFIKQNQALIDKALAKYNTALDTGIRRAVNYRRRLSELQAINIAKEEEQHGIAKDIIIAKLDAFNYLENNNTIPDKIMGELSSSIDNKNIVELLTDANNSLKKKLSGNDLQELKISNHVVPEENKFFNTFIKKYRGKVVYIDFWAPWCAPCIQEMPNSKRVLAEYLGKDVVFLYLAVDCTDDAWKKAVKSLAIKGDNYHLSKDEAFLLSKLFGVSSIPHYALISKSGAIADYNAPRPSDIRLLTEKIDTMLK